MIRHLERNALLSWQLSLKLSYHHFLNAINVNSSQSIARLNCSHAHALHFLHNWILFQGSNLVRNLYLCISSSTSLTVSPSRNCDEQFVLPTFDSHRQSICRDIVAWSNGTITCCLIWEDPVELSPVVTLLQFYCCTCESREQNKEQSTNNSVHDETLDFFAFNS